MGERRWDRDKARETVRKHESLRHDPWGDERPVRVGDVYTDRAYRLLWVAAVDGGEAVLEDADGRRERAPLRPRGGIEGLERVEVEAQGEARESWGSHGLRTLGRLPAVGDAFTFRPDGERLVVEAVDAECVTLAGGRAMPLGSFLGMVGEGTFVKEER